MIMIVAMVVSVIMTSVQVGEVKLRNQMQHGQGDKESAGKRSHHPDVPGLVQLETEHRANAKQNGEDQGQIIHDSGSFLVANHLQKLPTKKPIG